MTEYEEEDNEDNDYEEAAEGVDALPEQNTSSGVLAEKERPMTYEKQKLHEKLETTGSYIKGVVSDDGFVGPFFNIRNDARPKPQNRIHNRTHQHIQHHDTPAAVAKPQPVQSKHQKKKAFRQEKSNLRRYARYKESGKKEDVTLLKSRDKNRDKSFAVTNFFSNFGSSERRPRVKTPKNKISLNSWFEKY